MMPWAAHHEVTVDSTRGSTCPRTTYSPGRGSATSTSAGSAARRPVRSRRGTAEKRTDSPCSAPPVSSVGVPAATTRPPSTTTTSSASRSASSIRCVVSTTAAPPSRTSAMRSHTASRACGSSPALGSSRNTTSGRPTIAQASASRWRWPPESRRTAVPAKPSTPSRSASSATGSGVRVQARHVLEQLQRAGAHRQSAVLQHHADARPVGGVRGERVGAQHAHRAGIRATQPLAALDGGGLARSVGAEHGGDGPAAGGQVDPVDGAHASVGALQTTDDDGVVGSGGHAPESRSAAANEPPATPRLRPAGN